MDTQQPWEWGEPTWRELTGRIGAGRRLRPTWPGGARIAVALSFDADHECITLRDGHARPSLLSQGTYGARTAVPRILRLLEDYHAPATFFVPAVSGLLHPREIAAYVERGHEVALHGWIHERNVELPAAAERDLTLRAADTLERLSGRRPVGMRSPSWDFSEATFAIEQELGLLYDSSLMADDDCYEILASGEPTGMVEVPVEWIRDDFMYLGLNFRSGLTMPQPPEHFFDICRDELRGALDEGGLFQLTMHPHVSGHRSRLVWLRRLLDEIAQHDVWFATHEQVALLCAEELRAQP